LSIVIPVYNEHESLRELLAFVEAAMKASDESYEFVFVDDGSTDGSFDMLRTLAETRDEVRVFSFRRNLGKSAALACGFQKARRVILTVDADLRSSGNLGRMRERLVSERAVS
jgi:glycosyltransferase involved in cell wall biosynthesis